MTSASSQLDVVLNGPRIRRWSRRCASAAGFAFVLMLLTMVLINSAKRTSVLSHSAQTSMAESYFAGLDEPGAGSSRLRLQEFHRTAIKEGRTIWEIRASDAQYYSTEGVTHLDGASLILYQEDGSKISVKAEAAKLHMNEGGLSRAELGGAVHVEWQNGLQIDTESALYELEASEISAPGWVRISGDGYKIEGTGLRAYVEPQRVTLARNVVSVFTEGSGSGGGAAAASLFKQVSGGKEKSAKE